MKKTFFSLVVLVIFILLSRFWPIRKIECYTQFGSCAANYAQDLSKYIGKSLFWTRPKLVKAEVKSLKTYHRLPSTLVVALTLRTPIGVLGTSTSSQSVIADDSGIVYESSLDSQLPKLLVSNLPNVSAYVDQDQLKALKTLNLLSGLSSNLLMGKIRKQELEIYFSPQTIILVDLNKSISDWYPSLQVILNRSKITAKYHKVIDLRFSRPIISD